MKKRCPGKSCCVKFPAWFMIKTLHTYLRKEMNFFTGTFQDFFSQFTQTTFSEHLFVAACSNLHRFFYCIAYCSISKKEIKSLHVNSYSFMQFCWLLQSPCFIFKISLCNNDHYFDSKITVLTTPTNNQNYQQYK